MIATLIIITLLDQLRIRKTRGGSPGGIWERWKDDTRETS